MSNVIPGVHHSSAGWPTIEKSFNEDTMSREFDMSSKGVESIDGPSNRMSNGNAQPKSFKSAPDLADKFPFTLAMGSLTD